LEPKKDGFHNRITLISKDLNNRT